MTFTNFDSSKAGLTVKLIGGSAQYQFLEYGATAWRTGQIENLRDKNGNIVANSGVIGFLTGNYSGNWYEIISSILHWEGSTKYVVTNAAINITDSTIQIYRAENTPNNAENLFNKYLQQEVQIYLNLCASATLFNMARKNGVNIPVKYAEDITNLALKLEIRNNELQNILQSNNAAYDRGTLEETEELEKLTDDYLTDKISGARVGIVITTTFAIIFAVSFLAVFALALWLIYKRNNPESKVDLKYSDDLLAKIRGQVDDKTWKQFQSEHADLVTVANRAIEQNKAGFMDTIAQYGGYIALALFGVWGYNKLQEKKGTQQ
ncbi:MAG: hypothetical protein LBN95_13705 [Prevotellaceae bacterium]|jgi:hypothetical protein|nr:hypothetical protein [Prevotellaceae bacterium]